MKKLVLVVLAFLSFCAQAQYQTGVLSSNYAGVMGVTINPSTTNWLSNGTDIMPYSSNIAVDNNGFYFNAKSLPLLLGNSITQLKSDTGSNVSDKFQRIFDIKRSLKPENYVFLNATVYGPSFLTNIGRHSFGLVTSFRGISSTVGMAPDMAELIQKNQIGSDQIGRTFIAKGTRTGAIATVDLGFNYSTKVYESYRNILRVGANLHYLMALNSVYFADYSSSWTFAQDSTIRVSNGNFNFGYAATSSEKSNDWLKFRGTGEAVDFGFTYIRKNRPRPNHSTMCPNIRGGGKIREYQTYKWRFGASLMDLGSITFNKQTVNNLYGNVNAPIIGLDSSLAKGIFAIDRKLFYAFSGIPNGTYQTQDKFTFYMPTRIQVQFDYFWKDNWYFNFAASQRVVLNSTYTTRTLNVMSVGIRHETYRKEWAVPVTLIEYNYPLVGFYYRYGSFFIGTNHALEFIGVRDIKGVDIYFGFKFNIKNLRGI